MSNEKFTQGEWHIWKDNSTIPFIFGEDGDAVALMCGKQHYDFKTISRIDDYIEPEKVLSNAHLIAAAPEMYHALVDLVGKCRPGWREVNVSDETIEKALKALKKARGLAEGENK